MGSHARLSITSDAPHTPASPELLELLASVGLSYAEGGLGSLGVSLVSDLEYVTDAELEQAGLLPVHWRKLRTAAAEMLGLDGALQSLLRSRELWLCSARFAQRLGKCSNTAAKEPWSDM